MVTVFITVLTVYHNTPRRIATKVTNTVFVIVTVALIRHPYTAYATLVLPVCIIVLTVSVDTVSSFSASVAESIFVIVNMSNALQFIAASFAIANAIFVMLDTNVE
jgi:hypothetical protein